MTSLIVEPFLSYDVLVYVGLISILLVGTVIYTVRKSFQTNNDFTRLGSSSNHSEYDGSVNDDEMIKTKNIVPINQNTASSTSTEGDGNGTSTVKDFIKKGQSFFKQNLGQKVTQYSVVKSPFSIVDDEEDDDNDDDHDDGGVKINEYYNSKTSITGKYGDDLDAYNGEFSQEADGKDVGSDDEDNNEYDENDDEYDDVSDELEAKL